MVTAVHNVIWWKPLWGWGEQIPARCQASVRVRRVTMIHASPTGSTMAAPDSSSLPAPAALAAFLRGCERRGAVFAELQCGDADRGDVALAAALRAFRGKAAGLPMADWPVRFWALLVATPQLRVDGPGAGWPGAFAALARPATADRAALLLRLAGGLQEAEAAEVLGLDGAAYRDALARACPRDALGHPDAAGWRAVADAIQQHLRELPADRLATLARLREDALAGTRLPPTAPTTFAAAGETPRRGRWIVVAFVLLLVAIAAAAALWWWRSSSGPSVPVQAAESSGDEATLALPPDPEIIVAALPPAEAPAARVDATSPVDPDPDDALLADADEPRAREADFLAWYVAGGSAAQATATEVANGDR